MKMQAKDNAANGKPNKRQQRKHITQMSNEEITFLENVFAKNYYANNRKLIISEHVTNKINMGATDLDMSVVTRMLHQFKDCLIEYSHMKYRKGHGVENRRVLLRSKEVLYVKMDGCLSKCNFCMVVDIDRCEIVTTWFNHSFYNHVHLRLYRYDKNLNILNAKCNKRFDKRN